MYIKISEVLVTLSKLTKCKIIETSSMEIRIMYRTIKMETIIMVTIIMIIKEVNGLITIVVIRILTTLTQKMGRKKIITTLIIGTSVVITMKITTRTIKADVLV